MNRWMFMFIAAGLVTSTALALPWDVDMADAQTVRGYEADMGTWPCAPVANAPARPKCEDPALVVAQTNVLTPVGFTPNYGRGTPEGEKLRSPFPSTDDSVALGKQMYDVHCHMCHGDGKKLGPVAAPGRFPGVIALAGPSGNLKNRTDGYIYLTIRNGGAIMPYYGWAMDDTEMWSLVHYVRTLDGAAYKPKKAKAKGKGAKGKGAKGKAGGAGKAKGKGKGAKGKGKGKGKR